MEKTEKIALFSEELNFVDDVNIRHFAEVAISNLPDYFFEVPASSTGKYHPSYSLGDGGLYRHTRAAIRIAKELFRLNDYSFFPIEKDLIIVSLMLHDGRKSGDTKNDYSLADHPKIQTFAMKEDKELEGLISKESFEIICKNIDSHMGQWNFDWKTKREILPVPESAMQKFVHLCDYLASRKCLEMNFDVEIAS